MSKDRSFSTALHILTVLAYRSPDLVVSSELGDSCQTNPSFIRRILLKLSQHQLIISTKGKSGGNQLAKPADQITLREVYRVMKEGPLIGFFDKDPYPVCIVSRQMGGILEKVFENLEDELEISMSKITVSDLVEMLV